MWGTILILTGVGLLIPTAYAGLIGAPFAPTRRRIVRKAFEEIRLGGNDVLIDLGAGDGKIVLEAARRGATAVGYELSPIMWFIAKLRVGQHGQIRFGNFYQQNLSEATVLFAFLTPKTMPSVKKQLAQQVIPHGKYLLVYAFPFRDVEPEKVVTLPQQGAIYIYDLQKLTKQLA